MARARAAEASKDDQGLTDAARKDIGEMVGLRGNATESTKLVMPNGIDPASQHAGEPIERLARQSKPSSEPVTYDGTVLGQIFQDASRRLFDLGQTQFQRNLEGLNKLSRAKSVQEIVAIQSDLIREGLQHMVQDSTAITETSARAVEDASKTFSTNARAR